MTRPKTKDYGKNYKRKTYYISNESLVKLETEAESKEGGKTAVVNAALELYFAIRGPLEKLYKG